MSRSKWKGPFLCFKTLKNSNLKKKIMSRNSFIVPSFIGLTYLVHNGKNYSELTINENMIGHKFGEFSFTRVKFLFKKKKLKK